ncbi:ATP-binding protein [Salinivirga cyanobacteriivorans]
MSINKRLFFIILLIPLLYGKALFSQPDTSIYINKVSYYRTFAEEHLYDSDSVLQMINRGIELAVAASDTNYQYDFYSLKGDFLKHDNKYEQALEAYKNARDIIVNDEKAEKRAQIAKKIGALHWKYNYYKNANKNFQQALYIYQQLGDAIEVGKTFNNLGTISRDVSRMDSALYYYRKALTIFNEAQEKKWVAHTLNLIGNTYLQLNNTNKAIEHYEESLDLRRAFNDSIAISKSLTNIARVYKRNKQFEQSLEYFNKALEIRQNLNEMTLVASSLNDIGGLYRSMGNYAKSIEYFQRALIIRRQKSDQLDVAASLLNVGSIYKELELPETALEYYTEALEIYQQIGDEIRISNSLNYIGGVYYKQGEYDHALDYFLSALGYREVVGDQLQIAGLLNNVAMIYKNMGNYEKSLEYYQKALEHYKNHGDKKFYAATQNHIGNLFIEKEAYDEALEWLKNAYTQRRKIGDDFGFAHSALDIGSVYLKLSKEAAAMAFLMKSLEVAKKLNNFQLLRDVYFTLYKVSKAMRREHAALRYHEKYAAWKDSVFNHQTLEKITRVQMQNEAERTRLKIAFENKQKQEEIARLKKNRQEKERFYQLKVENERNFRNLIIAIAISLLLIVVLLVNRFMIKNKANKKLKKVNDDLSNLNQKLQKSQKELRQLNATKDKFFSIIAHDLRSPFTALVSLSEVLYDKDDEMEPGRRREIIGQISSASRSTFRLLENLLEWSRTQQGKIEFQPQKLLLKEVLDEVLALQMNNINQKQINFHIELNPDLHIYADRHMLSFILRNLLGNAIKFTPFGGEISFSAKDGSRDTIVKISDTGVGMTKQVVDKLFDINVHHTTEGTNKEKGVGLGLILCKEFIDKMNGAIHIESTPGSGSAFTFSIPKDRVN